MHQLTQLVQLQMPKEWKIPYAPVKIPKMGLSTTCPNAATKHTHAHTQMASERDEAVRLEGARATHTQTLISGYFAECSYVK